MGRPRSPISRGEAMHLLEMARKIQPPGEASSFIPTGVQARAARVALGRTVEGIAALSGLSAWAIENLEAGVVSDRADSSKVGWVLGALGAVFVRKGELSAVVFRS